MSTIPVLEAVTPEELKELEQAKKLHAVVYPDQNVGKIITDKFGVQGFVPIIAANGSGECVLDWDSAEIIEDTSDIVEVTD